MSLILLKCQEAIFMLYRYRSSNEAVSESDAVQDAAIKNRVVREVRAKFSAVPGYAEYKAKLEAQQAQRQEERTQAVVPVRR